VGEPQRAAGRVGNRALPDDAVVQHREQGKRRQGWEGEWDNAKALRSRPPVSGASEAPSDSERRTAAHRGQGARESPLRSTHDPHEGGEYRAHREGQAVNGTLMPRAVPQAA
jgi:hypothetical protein